MSALAPREPATALSRRLLPSLCIGASVLAGLIRLPVIEWMPTTPDFAAIGIYYWSLVRPQRTPMPLLFVLGLIVDSVGQTAFGTHALLYLSLHLLCRLLRRALPRLGLLLMWGCFGPCFLIVGFALWALISLASENNPPLSALGGYWLVTLIAYPLLHLLFDRALAGSQRWKL